MKKKLSVLISFISLLVLMVGFSACGKTDDGAKTAGSSQVAEESSKKKVTVTTSFLLDMVNQLAGDKVETELIIPAGEDPHLYVAKTEDLKKLTDADLVLYHGLHFEGKMVEALEKSGVAVTKNFTESDTTTMDEDGEKIVDPHFWFDITLYKKAVAVASEELQTILPDDQAEIKANAEKYLEALDELDAYNQTELAKIPAAQRYLITPHDAFNYFSRSYDIEVVAPQGVSTESEVSTTGIQDTIDFIYEHKVKAIFAESTTDPARMEKLKEGVKEKGGDVKVVSGEGQELFSDSLAVVGADGDTFIDMYKHNTDLMVANLK